MCDLSEIDLADRPYWSTLKIANDLPIFASYYAFVIVSLTWLAYFLSRDYLSYQFTRFFYLFSVSLWRRANARNVRLYYPYWQYTDLFDLHLYSAYAAHYIYFNILFWLSDIYQILFWLSIFIQQSGALGCALARW